MVMRKIIEIDEDRCNGCGRCISNCPEGALNKCGKATDLIERIVSIHGDDA